MSVRINLTLEASEMFLSLHMIFSLERAVVVWAILERISGFDPSLEMIAPRYLKFSTCNHELYICFENVSDNYLEDYIKAQKPTFLIQKCL